MSSEESEIQHTQHAFLVAWGWFAEHIGLIRGIQAVPIKQKRYYHTPQGKVLEFLVAILAGLKHLGVLRSSPTSAWPPTHWTRTWR